MPDENAGVIIVMLPGCPERPRFIKKRKWFRELFHDFYKINVNLIPIPYPPFYPPIDEEKLEYMIREFKRKYRRFWHDDWEYWLHRLERDWPDWDYLRYEYRRYLPDMLHALRRLLKKGIIQSVMVLWMPDMIDYDIELSMELKNTFSDLNVIHVNIGPGDRLAELGLADLKFINYPNERDKLHRALRSLGQFEREKMPAAQKIFKRTPEPDDIFLGTASPNTVTHGEEFTARFTAYKSTHRIMVREIIDREAPSSEPRLDLESCKWKKGAKVTVRCHSNNLEIQNPVQKFEWNGTYHILRFDAKVRNDVSTNRIIIKFDVAVEGLPIVFLRPEINLIKTESDAERVSQLSLTEDIAPETAFASYAKGDRGSVLGRVRSLQIYTGIDVFLDCLSIRPGEKWKPKLEDEIRIREIFWLFWSRRAKKSEWVEWEWRTALKYKSLEGIQPHPLEPEELAPPPEELSDLQFGSMYEWYLTDLKKFRHRPRRAKVRNNKPEGCEHKK
jgi:hypothetical protein